MTNQDIIIGSLLQTSLIAHIHWEFQCQFSLTLSLTTLFFPGTLFRKYRTMNVVRITTYTDTNYSRIPLFLHPWYGTSAELSDILNYHTVTKFSTCFQECTLVSYFHSVIKRLSSSIIICPVTGFPSQHNAVNHLHSTLSNCINFGCFSTCHLKRSSTLSLYAINDHN